MPFSSQRLRGALASLCLTALLSGCGGGGSSPAAPTPTAPAATGQISGQVLSATDASPVPGARITAAGTSTVSDAQGRFTLGTLAPASAVVLRIQADGHLDAVLPLPVTADQSTNITQRLVAAGKAQTFSAEAPGTLRAANSLASVDLPANGFVIDGSSTAATGTLSARISVIDPARDPAAMPGRYVASSGRAIESFGAINVDLRDAAGNKLNLKAGATATVRIPLASRSATPPASVPLFHLDEATGQWVQDGQATLKTTVDGSYYEGTVSHFSSWNADMEMDTIFVNGCVNDSAGKPTAWAYVQATGLDYSGMDAAVTDAAGKFRVAIRKSSLAELVAIAGERNSSALAVGPSATDVTLPNCLVLTDAAAPKLLGTLADRTVVAGQRANFRVNASGSALRYQWQRNGADLPGETFDTLSVTARLADDGARYSCVVRNGLGQVTSAAALLHVNPATLPVITEAPHSASALVGATASFTATVAGSAPLSYQWQHNGADIAGATAATYTTPALTLADQGARYRVVVRNAYGSVTSAEATLSVTASVLASPSIGTQPAAVTTTPGQTASFVVLASGNPAPTYQWLKNGTAIGGATSASYTTPVLALGDSGTLYSVRVSNSQGEVVSTTAQLTVQAPSSTEADQANLMRLLGTSGIWLQAASAPLEVSDDQGRVRSSTAVCQSGSVSTMLGGVTPAVGQALPAGGVLATRFTDCVDDGTRYNGSASADYSLTSLGSPINGSATVTLSDLRMADASAGSDYTVTGSAGVKLAGLVDGGSVVQTVILTPVAGSRIVNNLLALSATVTGGSLSVTTTTRSSDQRLTETHFSYVNLAFDVAGTPYVAAGSLALVFNGANGALSNGNGEITLFSSGAKVGRLYFGNGGLQIEVSGHVQPFATARGRVTR